MTLDASSASHRTQSFGLWAGLAAGNTAEAAASGTLHSNAAAKFVVNVKTTRSATIGFVVFAYALCWANRGQAKEITNRTAFLWQKFPKFVLGFIIISALATAGVFNKAQLTDLEDLSRWTFLLTFAGVGLRTDLREMRKQGFRPFVVGAVGELAIAAITLVIVLVTASVHHTLPVLHQKFLCIF